MTRLALAALPLVLLAGCVPPPVLSLAGRTCDPAPQMAPAHDVALGSSTTAVLDAASPCLDTPAGPASYVVFALPAAADAYRITVRSQRRGPAMLAPDATIYLADEHPRRSLGAFRAEAGTLVATATAEPADRYLVVTSTPGSVGRQQRIPTAADAPRIRLAAVVVVPIIIPTAPVGPTTDAFDVVLAHSGTITVSTAPFVRLP